MAGLTALHLVEDDGERAAARYAVDAAILQASERVTTAIAGPITDPGLRRQLDRSGIDWTDLDPASKAGRRQIQALVAEFGVDLIFAHGPRAAAAAREARKARGDTVHYVGVLHRHYPLSGLIHRRRAAALLDASLILAVSNALVDHARDAGVPPGRLRLVRPAIDRARFDPAAVTPARVVSLSDQWRLSDGAAVILIPRIDSAGPPLDFLINGLRRLDHPDLRCLILPAADAPAGLAETITEETSRARLDHMVHVVDRCDDLPAAYMLADTVVTPCPPGAGFDWAAAEAQAMGRAVIGVDCADLREITIPGKTAWPVVQGDVPALVQAFEGALGMDRDMRERLSLEARTHIARLSDRDRLLSSLTGIARDLIHGQLAET